MNKIVADKNGLRVVVDWKYSDHISPTLRKVMERLLTPTDAHNVKEQDKNRDENGDRDGEYNQSNLRNI